MLVPGDFMLLTPPCKSIQASIHAISASFTFAVMSIIGSQMMMNIRREARAGLHVYTPDTTKDSIPLHAVRTASQG